MVYTKDWTIWNRNIWLLRNSFAERFYTIYLALKQTVRVTFLRKYYARHFCKSFLSFYVFVASLFAKVHYEVVELFLVNVNIIMSKAYWQHIAFQSLPVLESYTNYIS